MHKTNIFDTIKNALNILKPIVDSKPKYYENTIIKKEQSTITHRGNHLLIDCRNVPKETCLDDKKMLEAMASSATEAGATVISQVRYKFNQDDNGGAGFTTMLLLNESHVQASSSVCYISSHAYIGLMCIDVFTCGKTDPKIIFDLIKSKIDLGDDIVIKHIERFKE